MAGICGNRRSGLVECDLGGNSVPGISTLSTWGSQASGPNPQPRSKKAMQATDLPTRLENTADTERTSAKLTDDSSGSIWQGGWSHVPVEALQGHEVQA